MQNEEAMGAGSVACSSQILDPIHNLIMWVHVDPPATWRFTHRRPPQLLPPGCSNSHFGDVALAGEGKNRIVFGKPKPKPKPKPGSTQGSSGSKNCNFWILPCWDTAIGLLGGREGLLSSPEETASRSNGSISLALPPCLNGCRTEEAHVGLPGS